MKRAGLLLLSMALVSTPQAGTVTIEAARDATLIEDPEGELANGAGSRLFVGRTSQSQNGIRRAVLYFDLTDALPRKALIESASLTLTMTPSHPEPGTLALHHLLAEWSEGPAVSGGGGGAPSLPGDVTWVHTSFDEKQWVDEGGQFVAHASATLEVGDAGVYTWESSQKMLQDVRLWKSAPHRNFGWILIGDESTPSSVKAFRSREHADPQQRPRLQVTFRMPGKP